ncbi:MAG: HlyD family efflux transporter periplasmic adaptor subunit [bacterium]
MKGHHYKQPRLTNYRHLWFRRIVRNWPFVLWLAALAFVLLFYSRNQTFGQMCGSVEVLEENVVPLETARLLVLAVQPGQHVKVGDVLAQMDTALIDAEIAVQDSSLRDARETFAQYQRGMIASINQAESAVKSAEAALQTEQMRQRSDAARADELRKELKRREDLLAKRLIDEMQVNEFRPELAALEQSLAAYPPIIANYQLARESAVRQLDVLQSWLRLGASGDLSAALSNRTDSSAAIVAATRETYLRRREGYTLRANREGTVGRLLVSPGNVVAAGFPIMNIVEEHPGKVVGFLPEFTASGFKVGQTVLVWRQNEAGGGEGAGNSTIRAVVESVSPGVESLPVRINPMQVQVQGGQPLRGRRLVFRLLGEHDLCPGETVEIHEIQTGWLAIPNRLLMWLTGHADPPPQAANPPAQRDSE